MTARQEKLFEVVKGYHAGQIRKYTGDPYWVHVKSVADMVDKHIDVPMAFEIALCHDLLEDTKCEALHLIENLKRLGYGDMDTGVIVSNVMYLTDVFTHKAFPQLNRKERKAREAERLGRIPMLAQSIKYADLIDNTYSIVRHDPKFAVVYLAEKRVCLDSMRKGHINLFLLAAWTLYSGLSILEADLDPKSDLWSDPDDPLVDRKPVSTIDTQAHLAALRRDLYGG